MKIDNFERVSQFVSKRAQCIKVLQEVEIYEKEAGALAFCLGFSTRQFQVVVPVSYRQNILKLWKEIKKSELESINAELTRLGVSIDG
jgi:hypothetical protein